MQVRWKLNQEQKRAHPAWNGVIYQLFVPSYSRFLCSVKKKMVRAPSSNKQHNLFRSLLSVMLQGYCKAPKHYNVFKVTRSTWPSLTHPPSQILICRSMQIKLNKKIVVTSYKFNYNYIHSKENVWQIFVSVFGREMDDYKSHLEGSLMGFKLTSILASCHRGVDDNLFLGE